MARAALSASTLTDDTELATFYAAAARVALKRARDEVRGLASVLAAREEELVRRGAPKAQLSLTEPQP